VLHLHELSSPISQLVGDAKLVSHLHELSEHCVTAPKHKKMANVSASATLNLDVFKMLHPFLVLLSTVFISSASAAILRNYTITVPEGTSDHNDPNLLCTPSGWRDIIIFYLGNYIAHVATIISLPGESARSKLRVSLTSLLFPVSGLMRGLLTILTFASFGKTDLQKAARARALCMVVRNQDWRPEPGDIIADAYLEETKTQSPSRDAAGTVDLRFTSKSSSANANSII